MIFQFFVERNWIKNDFLTQPMGKAQDGPIYIHGGLRHHTFQVPTATVTRTTRTGPTVTSGAAKYLGWPSIRTLCYIVILRLGSLEIVRS